MAQTSPKPRISGRCYCGATRIEADRAPRTVSYCHCLDCRRATGAPVAAFAAFDEEAVAFHPNEGRVASVTPGVTRSFCEGCGSALAGRYDYLPGTVYVALGLLDQADALAPERHSHHDERLTWLHIDDNLERCAGSARAHLERKK